ncbi:transcriptional regulator [Enterococcus faecium]|nr:transcriptional regulator [Enterococcus faecium]MCH3285020.1 transcriptional regulator [Enterococcus faecium]MCH3296626.1 transcriptional regulator [Enterococcus faecium]
MKRKSYDRWGIEITSFNRNIAFHVECDCGELAKSVYQKNGSVAKFENQTRPL